MDNEREQKDRYDEEPVNHVWYEDESTVQQDAEKLQSAAAPPPKPQRPEKQKKKRSAWKGIGIAFLAILLIFNTVASSFLLVEHFADKHVITQNVPQITPSASENIEPSASSGNELTVAEVNNKVSPSVVLITAEGMISGGQGTGVIISDDGYIVTNAHVVSGYSELTVTLNDENKSEYPATVVGQDEVTDIAVIRIRAKGLTPAEIGTSATLQVGQDVVVIGNPLGEEFTGSVTTGIISALDRQVEFENGQVYNYIQTNAAINSGNSGGPLVNMQGQVIGITAAKIDTSVAEGMGFAIPIDDVVPVANDLIEFGYVKSRPYIGVAGEGLDEQFATFYDLPMGVHITAVSENSPAAESGLQVDDIITHINDVEVSSVGQLNAEKNKSKPGDTVELTVYRYSTGDTITIKLVLGEQTPDMQ
ncbi:MAG: trypsin-like peptidase domain-containing protein [Firmicutes bacterium]|nr:trypsin-like peptidase domain-containing protein [Bacillota bacterium]